MTPETLNKAEAKKVGLFRWAVFINTVQLHKSMNKSLMIELANYLNLCLQQEVNNTELKAVEENIAFVKKTRKMLDNLLKDVSI